MRLKQFNPNKELKKLNHKYTKKHLIISLIVLVLLISIGSSYAIFSIQPEYHTFIKGTVGEFSTGDILLSVLVEGEKQDNFPAKDSGYAFESVTCENGTTGTWDNENWGLQVTFTKPDKCTINFVESMLFANYIKNLYNSENEGSNGLYYHDGQGTYVNADQEIGDNSYRYSGANPNNYVCFGTDVYPCPKENLYRIIGVFDNNVKLLGTQKIGTTYHWGGTVNGAYSWPETEIYKDLEKIYNNFSEKNKSLITNYNWSSNGISYFGKIGMFYPLDYRYGNSSLYWNENESSSENWLFIGAEMTLEFDTVEVYNLPINAYDQNYHVQFLAGAQCSGDTIVINETGEFGSQNACMVSKTYSYRLSFYLNSNVSYVSGTGSENDPYIIN